MCDKAFRRDMKQKCFKTFPVRRRFFASVFNALKNVAKIGGKIVEWIGKDGALEKCKHGAEIYYDAVEGFGHAFYAKEPPTWCAEECAKRAGDPYMKIK